MRLAPASIRRQVAISAATAMVLAVKVYVDEGNNSVPLPDSLWIHDERHGITPAAINGRCDLIGYSKPLNWANARL